jgi:hypothetical protein
MLVYLVLLLYLLTLVIHIHMHPRLMMFLNDIIVDRGPFDKAFGRKINQRRWSFIQGAQRMMTSILFIKWRLIN